MTVSAIHDTLRDSRRRYITVSVFEEEKCLSRESAGIMYPLRCAVKLRWNKVLRAQLYLKAPAHLEVVTQAHTNSNFAKVRSSPSFFSNSFSDILFAYPPSFKRTWLRNTGRLKNKPQGLLRICVSPDNFEASVTQTQTCSARRCAEWAW